LDHQTCKNRWPYNLYCVGADIKPCSINQEGWAFAPVKIGWEDCLRDDLYYVVQDITQPKLYNATLKAYYNLVYCVVHLPLIVDRRLSWPK